MPIMIRNDLTLYEAAKFSEGYRLKNDKKLIYDRSGNTNPKQRTELTVELENPGGPTAIAIGLNPSTGSNGKSDNTLRAISTIFHGLGYSSFTMLNLYTYRQKSSEAFYEWLRNIKCEGREEKFWTRFADYDDELKEASAIFIVCGKRALGEDPRSGDKQPLNANTKGAITNMVKGIIPYADKTWHVMHQRTCNKTWTRHPAFGGWTSDLKNKRFERFPLSEYMPFL